MEENFDLKLVQGFDKGCMRILDKSPSVHLYNFNSKTIKWVGYNIALLLLASQDKTTVGGVIFVCKRSTTPFYSFLLLNRSDAKTNIIEPINEEMLVEIETPYLLYKTRKAIHSIWFHGPNDCERIGRLLIK